MAVPGGSQTLTFQFFDESTGQPADPTALQLDLTYGEIVGAGPDVAGPFTYSGASSPGLMVVYRTGTGQYAFTWDIPTSVLPGVYVANWTATYGGSQWLATENFAVTPVGAVAGVAATLPLEPSDELVAVSWLSTVPGLTSAMVATTLPPDVDRQGNQAAWIRTGFVTVAVVGGNPDAMMPVNRTVMQVDCWATVPGSGKPPWWQAAAIASAIRRACWDRLTFNRPLVISGGSKQYGQAVVRSAYLATSFRRIYDDAAEYARYQGDLYLDWIKSGDRIY